MTLDEEKGKVESADHDATHDLENPLGTTNDNIEVRSDVLQSARQGLATEHEMSPWEAVKAYPMAIFWSLMVSMCVVMEGYDQIL